MLSKKFKYALLAFAMFAIGLDQFTKYLARVFIEENTAISFIPHWNWVLAYNHGAAFSFLADQGGWQRYMFSAISLLVSAFIVYLILAKQYSKLTGFAYACILGGAMGNFIDRAFVGQVTDFIDWYIGSYHWAAFNVADSFVCIGVALIVIEQVFSKEQAK